MRSTRLTVALAVLALGIATSAEAQGWQRSDAGWCDEEWGGRDSDRSCHMLSADFGDPGRLSIDGGMNGGVTVEGWNRDVVEVRAKVWANARSESRARELAAAVSIEYDDGELRAEGPDTERRESWGVTFEIRVPHATDLDIETFNGGISVAEVSGRIRFDALNGGVHLVETGGDVEGQTVNGGVHIELDGSSWSGSGMDVRTTNGGVTVRVPGDYSARLETRTVNGGIDIDFPVTVQGRIGRSLNIELGDVGPTVRAVTTNGGVRIIRIDALQ
jgi:hypothetical protein